MISPVRPIGPMIWAFGANAPMVRPTKSTAPTPSEKPPILIWPTRYPTPIARNAVRIGWLPMMSRARSNMCVNSPWIGRTSVESACLAPRVAKLADNPVHQIAAGRLGVFELVFKAHRLPLERTHLVKWLHLHPLDVLHGRDKSCDAIDIGGVVGLARHQREANPDRLRQRGQALGEAKRRREIAFGGSPV